MNKSISNLSGLFLVFLGGLALIHTTILPLFGIESGLWRLWPLLPVGIGFMFIFATFRARHNRGLGTLHIPGFLISTVGLLLLVASLFNWWHSWALFWPLLVIALAAGFAAAAVHSLNVWLFIPAIILGANGLAFQFCTLTGWWHLWSFLWTIEPLSVGLALILVSLLTQSHGLFKAGLIVTAVTGVAFSIMALLLSGWTAILAAIMLIATGGVLLFNKQPQFSDFLPKEKSPKEKLVDSL